MREDVCFPAAVFICLKEEAHLVTSSGLSQPSWATPVTRWFHWLSRGSCSSRLLGAVP